jgi:hypothetical protein
MTSDCCINGKAAKARHALYGDNDVIIASEASLLAERGSVGIGISVGS